MEQIEKQLNKKLDVIKIRSFENWQAVARELCLVKVRYNRSNKMEIMATCSLAGAQIVDSSKNMMLIQICDTPEKVQAMLELLHGVSIVEVARTGTLALPACGVNLDK